MNKNKYFNKFFLSLPSENTREFEVMITDFCGKYCETQDIEIISKLCNSKDEKTSFAAFYALCVIYRRSKSFKLLSSLINSNFERFKNHFSFNHIRLLYLIESDSIYDYDEILNMSYNDATVMSENAGYVHAFADVFVTICEKCEKDEREYYIGNWYNKAIEAVNRAIELDPNYAKYYCTKARILTLKKSFYEAIKLVKFAISIENSSRKDYALRISGYQFYNMYILLQQSVNAIETKESPQIISHSSDNKILSNKSLVSPDGSPFAFISYSHNDSETVKKIVEKITTMGHKVWFDDGLKPGEEFWEILASRISNCSCLILFLSSSSVDSGFVRREINNALEEKKKIISVYLDDVLLSPGMRIQLNIRQNITFNSNNTLDDIVNLISEALITQGV